MITLFALASLALVACSSSNPVDCSDDGTAPKDLECTGLYSSWDTKTLAPNVKPYTPALQFWSDGAEKSRFVMLPDGAQIDTTDMDEWKLPIGTKVWKEFRLNGKRVETRLMWKKGEREWLYTSYLWSEDDKRAPKIEQGAKVGNYEIPDTLGCFKCHKGRKDVLLGFDAVSLGLPGAQGVTLETLKNEGKLSTAPAKTSFTIPEDATGKAAAALGWMHTNCGTACHNTNPQADGFAPVSPLLTTLSAKKLMTGIAVEQTDVWLSAMNVRLQGSVSLRHQGYRIKSGDPAQSLVVKLADSRGIEDQMPPLATHVIDRQGVDAVKAWIAALPP
jgi:hypothetical protein